MCAVVLLLSHAQLFGIPQTAARQASLFLTISQSLLKLMTIESVMPSNHLNLCHSLLLLSLFPSIRVFPNELALCIRWPKYWSFNINLSSEYSGLISFRIRTKEPSAPQFKSINSSSFSFLHGPTLTLICDYWRNNSFD